MALPSGCDFFLRHTRAATFKMVLSGGWKMNEIKIERGKKIMRPEDQHGKEDQYGGPCCIHTNINSIYRQQLVHSLGCSTLFFMIRLRPGPFTSFLRSLCVHDKQKDPQRKEEEEKQIDKRRYLLLIGHSVPQTARYNVYCAALLRWPCCFTHTHRRARRAAFRLSLPQTNMIDARTLLLHNIGLHVLSIRGRGKEKFIPVGGPPFFHLRTR